MVLGGDRLDEEEHQISKIIISIICLYGNDGLPLDKVDSEFQIYCGYPIPYKKFGADTLRSWLLTLNDIYIVQDDYKNEVLIEQSQKSNHIKELILKQKNQHQRPCFFNNINSGRSNVKRKPVGYNFENFDHYERPYKMQKRFEVENLPQGSFLRVAHPNVEQNSIDSSRFEKFEELESMLPLFYKHQALGDDFFLDIADTKLGYYVPENGPKECGLCVASQTIWELTERVKNALYLAPRVVIMVGFEDLLKGQSVSKMISDLRQLVIELKKRNTCVTLITLIESPKLPNDKRIKMRMEVYNNAILDYASDEFLQCNIIDMKAIFEKEVETFRKDFDRLKKIAKKDPYKVFSDYGRKIFLSALRSCLKEQIEYALL